MNTSTPCCVPNGVEERANGLRHRRVERSAQSIAERSGRLINQDEPELVVEAIRQAIAHAWKRADLYHVDVYAEPPRRAQHRRGGEEAAFPLPGDL